MLSSAFFFNGPPPTSIYTLSLHDALPIFRQDLPARGGLLCGAGRRGEDDRVGAEAWDQARVALRRAQLRRLLDDADRKSTRLNSSHRCNSYAVFCLKKKKNKNNRQEADEY